MKRVWCIIVLPTTQKSEFAFILRSSLWCRHLLCPSICRLLCDRRIFRFSYISWYRDILSICRLLCSMHAAAAVSTSRRDVIRFLFQSSVWYRHALSIVCRLLCDRRICRYSYISWYRGLLPTCRLLRSKHAAATVSTSR